MKGSITFTLLIVTLLIMGFLQSCGSRATDLNVLKQSEKVKEEINSEGSVKKQEDAKEESKSVEQADKTDEKQEQRVTELYDENGKLKQRITELLNSKSTDKSSKSQTVLKTLKITNDSTFKNTVFKEKVITLKIKDKKTEVNNTGWIIGLVVLGALVILFCYLYLKKRSQISKLPQQVLGSMF